DGAGQQSCWQELFLGRSATRQLGCDAREVPAVRLFLRHRHAGELVLRQAHCGSRDQIQLHDGREARHADGTPFAPYPHQWKISAKGLRPQTYASVRGVMKLAEGTSFTTRMRFPGVLPSLPDLGTYNRTTLANYVNEAEAEVYDGSPDTYWFGKR